MKKTRITWNDVPDRVKAWVENELGSSVVQWRSQSGGWSPGTADRLTCADGSRAFLKAVHPGLNPVTPGLYRDEIRVAPLLGRDIPCAHLIASYDDGEWVALLFEDIEGQHPRAPWRRSELRSVLTALDDIAAASSPSRTGAPQLDALPPARELYAEDFARFDELDAGALAGRDPWLAQNVTALAERGRRAGSLVDGDFLGHGDLRADNILVQPDGRVRIVDWPNACRSAPWIDGVLLAPNIEVLGGLRGDGAEGVDDVGGDAADADGSAAGGPATSGAVPTPDATLMLARWAERHGASQDDVLDVLVGMLAYFTWASAQPQVPGLPTLRRDQGVAATAALRVVQRLWPTS